MGTMSASGNSRRSLDRFFTDSARLHATRSALCIGEQRWTYDALRRECNAIRETLGAIGLTDKQANIGVLSAKSLVSYASIIATMESNNVYVPLNPKFPADRLLKM